MKQLDRAALGAAVTLSVFSVGDAVLRATSDAVPPWDDEQGTTWSIAAVGVLVAATFVLLAAVLFDRRRQIDAGHAARSWVRRLLVADLAVLAFGGLLAPVVDSEVLGVVAGVGFVAMFVLGAVLGALLLGRRNLRLPAALMVAGVPVLGLTFALEALAPGWGHPGYAETVLYLGIALVGTAGPVTRVDRRPVAADR